MKTLTPAEGLHFATADGEYYLTVQEQDVVVCVNHAAFALIGHLDGTATVEKVGSKLEGAGSPEFQAAAKRVAGTLLELGVLKPSKGERAAGRRAGRPSAVTGVPEIKRVWQGSELLNGLFVKAGDISVIVPNITDGPIKTCPPHTCTVPAGLFSPETVIQPFGGFWETHFAAGKE